MKLHHALFALTLAALATTTTAKASSSLALVGANDASSSLSKEVKVNMRKAAGLIRQSRRRRRRHQRNLMSGRGSQTGGETLPPVTDVMIKNMDCSACMEAPAKVDTSGRQLRGVVEPKDDRGLASSEVFVTALNCDANNAYQTWDLLPLDTTGTWFHFYNPASDSCMQLVGECSFDDRLYSIEMGDACDDDVTNAKAIWGVTGLGEIVNFECFVNGYHSHSTPDVFLEAQCSAKGGIDKLDISSLSDASAETASNYWAVFSKTLLDPDEDFP